MYDLMFCFIILKVNSVIESFFGGSDGKESAYNAGDLGLIPGSERSPEEGNGNPFQYSCLENSRDKGVCTFSYLSFCVDCT